MKLDAAPNIETHPQLDLTLLLHGEDATPSKKAPSLNLHDALLTHRDASFATYARDDSLAEMGIHQNDLLLCDRKLKPNHLDIVVARNEGELYCYQLDTHQNALLGELGEVRVELKTAESLFIEGVVTQVVKAFR